MNTIILSLAGALFAAPPQSAVAVPLRLSKGQELVYRGTYQEEISRPGARYTRHYEVEAYVLILDAGPRELRGAFLTSTRLHSKGAAPAVSAVRLEIGKIQPTGRVTFTNRPAAPPFVPLGGPPTLETSAFVELPKDGLDVGKPWQTSVRDEPSIRWSLTGIEYVGGRCAKLLGEQRSLYWGQAGHESWKREERVWVQLQGGYASKIDRLIQHRDEVGDTVFRSKLSLELDNSHNPVFHPGGTFKVRLTTVERTAELTGIFDDLVTQSGRRDQVGFDGLLNRIDFMLRNVSDTPYREALVALRRQAQAALAGERPPAPITIGVRKDSIQPLAIGQPMPSMTVSAITGNERLRLADLHGKPAMLTFVKGSSPTIDFVLRYLVSAQLKYSGRLMVVPLVIEGTAALQTRCNHMKIAATIYDGAELHRFITGSTTPLTVIFDKAGAVRVIAKGWGGEYPEWLDKEIQKLLKQ